MRTVRLGAAMELNTVSESTFTAATLLSGLFFLFGPFVAFATVLAVDERRLLHAAIALVGTEVASYLIFIFPGLPLSWELSFVILRLAYVVPSILAFGSKHPERWLILLLNFLTGATIIGWVVTFVWALWPQPKSPPRRLENERPQRRLLQDLRQ